MSNDHKIDGNVLLRGQKLKKVEQDSKPGELQCFASGAGKGTLKLEPRLREDIVPHQFRMAFYPDGRKVLQGAYYWSKGFATGVVWKDVPTVYVDENGEVL